MSERPAITWYCKMSSHNEMQTLQLTISTYLAAHADIMDCFMSAVIERLPGNIAGELKSSLRKDAEEGRNPNQPSSNIVRQIKADARFMRVELLDLNRLRAASLVVEEWVARSANTVVASYQISSGVVTLHKPQD